ncbi:hypothetical protein KAR91_84220 [Candidatus Pacearchaeota archaeon]|nr:hypothetical protein [Candidatus Pacearchaeota archaeon]
MSPKSNKSTSSESAPKKKKLTLAEGQAAAQANLASHSASLDAIRDFLFAKPQVGTLMSPAKIAEGLGNGITDKDVRKTMQKSGLASGKTGLIETGPEGSVWIYLAKDGNRNRYGAVPNGDSAPKS